jgi:hypothetical protein
LGNKGEEKMRERRLQRRERHLRGGERKKD